MAARTINGIDELRSLVGEHLGYSDWVEVTQDMVNRLKPGMTRSQVRFALGTPLIADPFHPDRWDYVYVYERKGRLVAKRRIAVVFKDDVLLRVEGDIAPAGTAKEGDPPAKATAVPAAPATPTASTDGTLR